MYACRKAPIGLESDLNDSQRRASNPSRGAPHEFRAEAFHPWRDCLHGGRSPHVHGSRRSEEGGRGGGRRDQGRDPGNDGHREPHLRRGRRPRAGGHLRSRRRHQGQRPLQGSAQGRRPCGCRHQEAGRARRAGNGQGPHRHRHRRPRRGRGGRQLRDVVRCPRQGLGPHRHLLHHPRHYRRRHDRSLLHHHHPGLRPPGSRGRQDELALPLQVPRLRRPRNPHGPHPLGLHGLLAG